MKTPDVLIFVVPETLSDKSVVYNVKLGNVTFHAVTESDAHDLAEGFLSLIEEHTNDTADTVYE